MPVKITHALALPDAQEAFPTLSSVVAWRDASLPVDQGLAFCVPEFEWPADLGVDAELLLLVLPVDLAPLLSDLATKAFDIANDISSDLLTSTTLITLSAQGTSVEVNGWTCKFHPSADDGKYYIALVAGDRFVLACHAVGTDDVDALLCALQGACGSSGPNYQPYRIWSQEQIDAAARGEDVLETEGAEAIGLGWERLARRVTCITVSCYA